MILESKKLAPFNKVFTNTEIQGVPKIRVRSNTIVIDQCIFNIITLRRNVHV